jgi:glycosyltransferase involved in cell wall biosynthesis
MYSVENNILDKRSMPTIMFVATTALSVNSFFKNHLVALSKHYKIIVGINTYEYQLLPEITNLVELHHIPFARQIDILSDISSLYRLTILIDKIKPISIQSINPKSGLLTMMASWVCRVPIRIHVFTGQVWVTRKGFSRWYLKSFDRLIAILATSLLADSPSQKQFLVDEGIVSGRDIQVLADGSVCGVDDLKFKPNADAKKEIRAQLAISEKATLALFIGRLTRDKGVLDLASAFAGLDSSFNGLYLVFVGPDEDGLTEQILHIVSMGRSQVRFVGHVNNPEDFIAAADFLCLPSYREGFGLVTIEAAAVGIPTLASRIYGITDAVIDGVTGLLHEPGDLAGIAEGLRTMAAIPKARILMGSAAQKRALELFPTSRVVNAQLNYYKSLIQKYRNHA